MSKEIRFWMRVLAISGHLRRGLPVRFALHAPLDEADHDVRYGARLDGCTDFPALEPASAKFACSARS
ncbi:hypothetical protein [Amycolatopsis sp. NPDC102389]|uniref:hypothetical protein n=1 Tax=Amycolatopsis sp. NPDC102389 TaxID=3363941 RepID=UPI003824F711